VRKRKRCPPIPKSLDLPGGPVPVEVVSRKKMQEWADKGEELFGYFHEAERRISILGTMSTSAQWRTLWHEWAHALFQDTGLSNGMNLATEESLCDAISSGLMRVWHG